MGVRNRVKNVDIKRPDKIITAKPLYSSEPKLGISANGRSPKEVVKVVINIGLTLCFTANKTDFIGIIPFLILFKDLYTIKIELLTTIPNRIIKPSIDSIFNGS